MTPISRALFAICLLFAVTLAKAAESPESVMLAFSAAMNKDGVAAALPRYMHPDETARFKSLFMPRFREASEANEKFNKDVLGETLALRDIEAMPPSEFMAKFLWRSRMVGKNVQPPRILNSRREGDVALLEMITDYTTLEGAPAQQRDLVRLKAFGNTWKMMLSPEMEAMAIAMPVTK